MNMQVLLKQAQKMQKDLGKAEAELRNKEYTASTGGGAIQVTVKGSMELTTISIQDEMLQAEAKEDLQELLVHTINDALQQAITDKENRMKQMTGGVKMPGGF
ncbi:MAG: YbaB/EbfC family nucleoid-associated protein [Erysipelotrichaceae bacterium]|nr:YbaB/EbfC family nucleoid-associated protein [Erysipelotrichaceae bacterium]MCI9312136.1 YbaB/EbfC family nucleoid-associated protein [Erysipelotrichaceae bacterium]